MSELINAHADRANFRRQLLTTVSAMALLAAVYGTSEAKAADQGTDRPTIWIEFGGDLEHMSGQGENFPVGFLATYPKSPVLQGVTPLQAQNPPPFDFAEEGKISFQPEGSNWIFSGAINYGRSSNFKHVDHQTTGIHYAKYHSGVPGGNIRGTDDFADTQVHHRESHAILDFSAGKDFGLGMFGRDGSSILSLGVRFAQFASNATFDVRARPDLGVKYFPSAAAPTVAPFLHFHTYHNTGDASRSFHGVGPSLSWNGSAPFVGNPQGNEVTFDWGANAALLFGRQKAHVQHQEIGNYDSVAAHFQNFPYALVYQHTGGHTGARSVIVPNAGGFAGISVRRANAKISLGYRADFFFGAIDGGIDARKSETLGLNGPYASISVGLGG